MKIAIINGPNLNLLGNRETNIYGDQSFDEFFLELQELFAGHELKYFQSNVEGELVNTIQRHGFYKESDAIVLNAGGYSHTSVAIADAVKATACPVISVHISNIYAREKERHIDLLAGYSTGQIVGLGLVGYRLAIEYALSQNAKGLI